MSLVSLFRSLTTFENLLLLANNKSCREIQLLALYTKNITVIYNQNEFFQKQVYKHKVLHKRFFLFNK